MRRTIALLLSVVVFSVLGAGCSDDTGTKKLDKGVKKDKGPILPDVETPDLPPGNPDLPIKVDQPVVKIDQPVVKVDQPVTKTDGKVDQPVVKNDVPKVDVSKVDVSKVDVKKVDQAIVKLDGKKDGTLPVPTNNKCATPKTLTLSGTPLKVVETGWTTGAGDEFAAIDCSGDFYTMDGPQVYYKVNLPAGKKYKAVLTGSFDAGLYAFPAATACTEAAIDAACKSPGGDNIYNSDNIGSSANEIVRIAPTATGDWIIVVDSYSTSAYGTFTLTISEVTPPTNGTCATAKALSFTAGKATENGDTSDASNEFTNTITCGNYAYGAFLGPQVYYRFNVATGKGMKITLDPTFSAYVYIFPVSASCAATAIETACASGGTTGTVYGSITAGYPESFTFNPTAAGDYILAVDASTATKGGTFTLTVEEFTPPTNAKCATPQAVTLTTSPVTVTGDTALSVNQAFTPIVDCGISYGLDGPQLYYKMNLLAGKTYTIEVTPASSFDVALWAFKDTTCTAATIQTQCSATGMSIDDEVSGVAETLTIAPTTTADYIIAVDSWDADEAGTFSMKISWQ